MDEIVKMVAQRTGVSEDKARTAVETVVGYLKGKLPAPVGSQLDAVLSGKGGEIASSLGAMLGRG